ncbi:hypothetical protein AB0D62_03255 [Streptomyces massasporeus]|uniref:hypothetical protein n=1 Tax=Streptomyces massasporeus TaxID=67324 RepID=UPI003411A3FB
MALVVTLGVVHAWFHGGPGTLFAAHFDTPVQYTGMSFVYQMSGIFASGITPLIMTVLLVLDLRKRDLHVPTGHARSGWQ